MVNIVEPKYSSKRLEELRNDAIRAVGETKYDTLNMANKAFCYITLIVSAILMFLLLFAYPISCRGAGAWIKVLFSILGGYVATFIGIIGMDMIESKTIHPIFQPLAQKLHWTDVCDERFLDVIGETKRVECFCAIVKEHPEGTLRRIEDHGVMVTYTSGNYTESKRFVPSLSGGGCIAKDEGLDFSYLDNHVAEFLE